MSGAAEPTPAEPTSPTGGEHRVATDAERKALASVLRMRILRMCLYEPLTNAQLAKRLGKNPATVLHHVRTLVTQGFLVADAERAGTRGAREVPYRSTGKSWNLEIPGGMNNTLLETFLAEVAQVPAQEVDVVRLGLSLSEQDKAEFWDRIHEVFGDFARRPHAPGGERVSVFLAIHPEAN